ncbi:MAG: hypothetical protein J6Y19_04085 [Kiritimatiellae bacterium]|nr:hypothetical protein [Kiritimatiellia bacterium]
MVEYCLALNVIVTSFPKTPDMVPDVRAPPLLPDPTRKAELALSHVTDDTVLHPLSAGGVPLVNVHSDFTTGVPGEDSVIGLVGAICTWYLAAPATVVQLKLNPSLVIAPNVTSGTDNPPASSKLNSSINNCNPLAPPLFSIDTVTIPDPATEPRLVLFMEKSCQSPEVAVPEALAVR